MSRGVRKLGDLRAGLDSAAATDILWILNDPAHYATLVLQRQWAEDAFRQWLTDSMRGALLPG